MHPQQPDPFSATLFGQGVAAFFLAAHAILHIYDTALGNLPSTHWVLDFAGVYVPAIVLGVAVTRLPRDSGTHSQDLE